MKQPPPEELDIAHEEQPSGILLVNKPTNKTSFALVGALRRLLKVKKIGHAGTLDPFATGVMVMLIGKQYTKLSDRFLGAEKEYLATLRLGIETDSYDCDGIVISEDARTPTLEDVKTVLKSFQGEILQTPPMFSAKKKNGQKLYDLARKGITIEREAVRVNLSTQLISYEYPHVELRVACSKGTYIRSIAHDIGKLLGCGAHLIKLERTRSGSFRLENCIDGNLLYHPTCDINYLKHALIKNIDIFL